MHVHEVVLHVNRALIPESEMPETGIASIPDSLRSAADLGRGLLEGSLVVETTVAAGPRFATGELSTPSIRPEFMDGPVVFGDARSFDSELENVPIELLAAELDLRSASEGRRVSTPQQMFSRSLSPVWPEVADASSVIDVEEVKVERNEVSWAIVILRLVDIGLFASEELLKVLFLATPVLSRALATAVERTIRALGDGSSTSSLRSLNVDAFTPVSRGESDSTGIKRAQDS